MSEKKIRLDDLLLELGFFQSKEKARTCIMMHGVSIDSKLENKAGKQINKEKFYTNYHKDSNYISVDDKLLPYVSRGAFKLEQAYKDFDLDFEGKVILDIGASTGGFTDFALEHGASKSYALDVGKGQLHYKLQNDMRVFNLEERNFRHWNPADDIDEESKIDMVLCDVSFISMLTILASLKNLFETQAQYFSENMEMVFLLKPQFEAGKEIMDKCQGVLKDEKLREKVCKEVKAKIQDLAFTIKAESESPIKGSKGNQEELLYLIK